MSYPSVSLNIEKYMHSDVLCIDKECTIAVGSEHGSVQSIDCILVVGTHNS